MARIYMEAFVTISAANASCIDEGFLPKRNLPKAYISLYKLGYRCPDGQLGSILLSEGTINNERTEPLDLRAWTLQEQKLSPRILRFGTKQLEFECAKMQRVDGGHDSPPEVGVTEDPYYFDGSPHKQRAKDKSSTGGTARNWRFIVEQYTGRGLKFPSDRLPAIAAIAEQFAPYLETDYLAGLWKSDLQFELCWRKENTQEQDAPLSTYVRLPPSWSWASIVGKVKFTYQSELRTAALEIVDCEIKLKSELVPYEAVESGRLTVKGRIQRVLWTGACLIDPSVGDEGTIVTDETFPDTIENLASNLAASLSVWCLEVTTVRHRERNCPSGIILMLENSIFKRVGYFEIPVELSAWERLHNKNIKRSGIVQPSLQADWFCHCKSQSITIV